MGMLGRLRAYVAAWVVLSLAAIFAASGRILDLPMEPGAIVACVAIAALIVLIQLEALPTRRLVGGSHTVTAEEVAIGCALVVLPFGWAVVAVVAAILISETIERRPALKLVFNVANRAAGAVAAVALTAALEPAIGPLAAVLGTASYTVVSWTANGGIAAITGAERWRVLGGELADGIVTGLLAGTTGVVVGVGLTKLPLLLTAAPVLVWGVHRWWGDRVRATLEHHQFQQTLTTASEGVALLDPRGQVVLCNPALAELAASTVDEIRGRHIGEVVPELSGSVDRLDLPASVELTLYTTDPPRDVLIDRDPLILPDGAVGGAVLMVRDISARRRLETVREDLVMRVSHELRTPLTLVKGFLETLVGRWPAIPDVERYSLLERALHNAERLDGLLDGLLVRQQIEERQLSATPTWVDISEAAARAVQAAGIGGDVTVAGSDIRVWADPRHVEQILVKLLQNAVQHGRPPISLRAALRSSDATAEVVLEDLGPGVPAELQEELFQPFFQASTGTRRTSRGFGLGLSIARGMADLNGGDLRYDPRGEGARFVLTLPATEADG